MSGEQLTAVLITTIITIGICSMLKLSVTLYAEYKNTIRENERMMKLQELSNDAIKQSLSTLESVSRMMTENERIAIEALDSLSNTKGDIEIDGFKGYNKDNKIPGYNRMHLWDIAYWDKQHPLI